MCTVSFIPSHGKIFLVSNRDEKSLRAPALYPARYPSGSGYALYPKDGDAGGTWIALHETGNAVVFLNGGTEAHVPKPPYRKSRGLVLLDIIRSGAPTRYFLDMELEGIEPFTAVIWDKGNLREGVWDGEHRHLQEKDPAIPHIWSSVTLYNGEVRARRKLWFTEWLEKNPVPNLDEILYFHEFSGEGDSHNDLLMNRNGNVYTVSITAIGIDKGMGQMRYKDILQNQTLSAELFFSDTVVEH